MILAGGAAELVQQEADARAARLNAQFFRTGSPVPRGWRPRPEKLSAAHRGKRSVARGRLVIYYPHAIGKYRCVYHSADFALSFFAPSLFMGAQSGPGAIAPSPRAASVGNR